MPDKTFPDNEQLELYAQRSLEKGIFDYFAGGAGKEISLCQNKRIYDDVLLIPRVLTGVTHPETAVKANSLAIEHPIMIAPTSYHQLLHCNGEIETAIAASQTNTIYCQSLMSTVCFEEISKINDQIWMQIYVLNDKSKFWSLIEYCTTLGVKNIVITVDTNYLGTRNRDRQNKFSLPASLSLPTLKKLGISSQMNYKNESLFAKNLIWDDLAAIKNKIKANVYLKGILHPKDAELAAQHNFAGLILSNHGGRQLDTSVHALQVLSDIRSCVGKQFPLIVDGGASSGLDVFKCLCLGADAVMVGRPILWALHYGGSTAITSLLNRMKDEFINAMRLCGVSSIEELKNCGKDYIYWGRK